MGLAIEAHRGAGRAASRRNENSASAGLGSRDTGWLGRVAGRRVRPDAGLLGYPFAIHSLRVSEKITHLFSLNATDQEAENARIKQCKS